MRLLNPEMCCLSTTKQVADIGNARGGRGSTR
jgi:hypothetical protein